MSHIDRVLLAARTARHLTPEQLLFWPLRRWQSRSPAPETGQASFDGASLRSVGCAATDLLRRLDQGSTVERADLVRRGAIELIGVRRSLGSIDWMSDQVNRLWTYHLHSFGCARDLAAGYVFAGNDEYVAAFLALAKSWIRATSSGGGPGWEPFPTSLRIVNWIYAASIFNDAIAPGDLAVLARSLHRQASFVSRRLERHLQVNHLYKNRHAVAVARLVLAGPDRKRRTRALSDAWGEVRRQVNGDGGHVERSPMYHVVFAADVLELITLAKACDALVPLDIIDLARALVVAAGRFSHSDGSLHQINDSSRSVRPTVSELRRMAPSILGDLPGTADGAWEMPLSGFFGFRDSQGDHECLVDASPPAPDYQPGHAHCGLLSFELDVRRRPLFVDSGVHGYDGDPFREYSRSTRAHNTVAVGAREQSELWGVFRVARRAVLRRATHCSDGGTYRFCGASSPYHDRSIVHERELMLRQGELLIRDRIVGAPSPARSYLHLDPRYTASINGRSIIATSADCIVQIDAEGVDELSLRRGAAMPPQGWYFPDFGVALPAVAIEAAVNQSDGTPFGFRVRWSVTS